MTTLPLSEAKAHLCEIADTTVRTHDHVHVTRNGRAYVVLMSAEEYDSWQATLELSADAEAQRDVAESQRAYEQGEYTTSEGMRQLLEQRRAAEGDL